MVGNGREWSQMVGVSGGGLCGKWWMVGGSGVVESGREWSEMVGNGRKWSETAEKWSEMVGNG